jgi:16S rRNA G1207 methylase RsmC
VLRPGGRFAISDVVADTDMGDATRADMAAGTGCVAGALTREEFQRSLADAGLVDVRSARRTASTNTRSQQSCVHESRRTW